MPPPPGGPLLQPAPIEACIDRAARMGFDGVEILQVQMGDDQSNARLQRLKRQAHALGLALMGFSTHQGFVNPDKGVRDDNVAKTLNSIDTAYRLGIPTMRINTGRWGTMKNFDELMANKGIEPTLPGRTDEEGFGWVIASIERHGYQGCISLEFEGQADPEVAVPASRARLARAFARG